MEHIKTPVQLEPIYADIPEHDEADIVDATGRVIAKDVLATDAHEIMIALNSRQALARLAQSILETLAECESPTDLERENYDRERIAYEMSCTDDVQF